MARTRELKVKITGDERDLTRSVGRIDGSLSKLTRGISGWTKGLAGAFAVREVVDWGISFVKAAENSVKVGKQTNAVIKSTGGIANVSAGQVAKLAEQLSLKAGIDDELIESGQNVLLTFTGIRNEVGKGNDIFNQATTTALDMSVALGQDLQSSVIQIGKALNDPIKGITALQRVGVTFTEQQREQIATLVESGDTLGAQKVILQELTKEFGGSAEAQATATDKLKVAFGNVSEQIGLVLLPYVNQFSDWLVKEGIPLIRDEFIPWLRDELIPALQDFAAWIRDEIIPNLEKVGPVIRDDILPALQDLTEAITALPGAVQVALASLGLLAKFGGFGVLAGAATIMGKVIATVFGFIGFAATMAFNLILRIAPFSHLATLAFIFRDKVTAAFRWIGEQGARLFANLQNWGATAVRAIGGFFQRLPGQIAGALGTIATIFRSAMARAWNAVTDFVGRIVSAIRSIPGKIAGVAGAIKDKLAGALGGIDLTPGFDLPGFGGFLAEGGIIPATPGGRLFVGGEAGVPEAVIPLDGRHGLSGGITNVTVVIDRPIVADEREFRGMVRRAVNDGLAQGTITKRGARL